MAIIKSLFKNKITSTFLILAFTLSILTFLIANTIINNQKEELKRYDIKNNKEVSFIVNKEIPIEAIKEVIKDNKVTMELKYFDDANDCYISTILVKNSFMQREKIIKGREFYDEENISNDNIGLVSVTLFEDKEDITIENNGGSNKLNIKGVFNDSNKILIIPNKLFYKFLGTDKINERYVRTIISGEPADIENAIGNIRNYLLKIDPKSNIKVFDYMKEDRIAEANSFIDASKTILLITIINSIGLTSLWVSGRKKELALRKAVGATDNNLRILYFKELLVMGMVSVVISGILYGIILKITGGYFKGLNLEFNMLAFIQAILLVFVTSFLVSIPSLIYLSKLNPAILLRED